MTRRASAKPDDIWDVLLWVVSAILAQPTREPEAKEA